MVGVRRVDIHDDAGPGGAARRHGGVAADAAGEAVEHLADDLARFVDPGAGEFDRGFADVSGTVRGEEDDLEFDADWSRSGRG